MGLTMLYVKVFCPLNFYKLIVSLVEPSNIMFMKKEHKRFFDSDHFD